MPLSVRKCKVKKIISISLLFNVYIECIPCPKGTEKNTTGCSPCSAIRFVPLSVCVKKGYMYQTMAQFMPLTLLQSN